MSDPMENDASRLAAAQRWLDRYVDAWHSRDPAEIGDLFAEGVRYYAHPWDEPLEGRDAVVAAWLEADDPPGSFTARYQAIQMTGPQLCMARGITTYNPGHPAFPDGAEFHNVFVLWFDDDGRVQEYREWYMRRPPENAETAEATSPPEQQPPAPGTDSTPPPAVH